MSAKSSAHGDGIKGLFVKHGEKVVFGLTVLLVGYLFWSAFGLGGVESGSKPEALSDLAKAASEKIASSEYKPDLTRIDFDINQGEVSKKDYNASVPWRPTKEGPPKRKDPNLLPVEDLRATGVMMMIPLKESAPEVADGSKVEIPTPVRSTTKARPELYPGYPQRGGSKAPPSYPGQRPRRGGGESGLEGGFPPRAGNRNKGKEEPEVPQPDLTEVVRPKPGMQAVGSKSEVRAGVLVVGRVPFNKQLEEYQRTFLDAMLPEGHPPESDVPAYVWLRVERAEAPAAGQQPSWKQLDTKKAYAERNRWYSVAEELVDQAFVDPMVSWPLPGLFMRDWGRLSTHPSIPLMNLNGDLVDSTSGTDEEMLDAIPEGLDLGDGKGAKSGAAGKDGAARANAANGGTVGTEAARADAMSNSPVAPTRLFRFLDMDDIVPGKQYIYRVTLVLENPNYQVDLAALADPKGAASQYRFSSPSAPTAPVTVPTERRLLATASKPAKAFTESHGDFQFMTWDKTTGLQVAKEFKSLPLGGAVDFVQTVKNIYNPITGRPDTLENFNFRYPDPVPPLLVDVRGGDPVPGGKPRDRVNEPAELLFVDGQGRLIHSSEGRDRPLFKHYETFFVEKVEEVDEGGLLPPEAEPTRGRRPPTERR